MIKGERKLRARTRDNMTITTVALPLEMHRALQHAAIEENAAATELVRQALSEWLDRRARSKRKAGGSR